MDELLEFYKSELEIQGQTQRTIKTYSFFVKQFLEYLKRKNKSVDQIDKSDLKLFLLEIHSKKKYSSKSFYNLILALKSFLRFLEREDLIKTLKLPKVPKSLPKALTKDEVKKLLEVTKDIRETLIVLLIYSTGLRVSEVRNLDIKDINLKEQYLIVRQGKGRKDRVVPIPKKLVEVIREYLKIRDKIKSNSDALFLNKFGNRMSYEYIEKIVRDIGKRVGIKVTCHMLRHSFATHMLENGADIRVIQEILGHEKLSTTQIYTKVTTKYLKEIYTKFNPLKDLEEELENE